jgi:hypothetical protein
MRSGPQSNICNRKIRGSGSRKTAGILEEAGWKRINAVIIKKPRLVLIVVQRA